MDMPRVAEREVLARPMGFLGSEGTLQHRIIPIADFQMGLTQQRKRHLIVSPFATIHMEYTLQRLNYKP